MSSHRHIDTYLFEAEIPEARALRGLSLSLVQESDGTFWLSDDTGRVPPHSALHGRNGSPKRFLSEADAERVALEILERTHVGFSAWFQKRKNGIPQ